MTGEAGGVTVRLAGAPELAAVRELVQLAGLPLDGIDDAAVVLVATDQERLLGTAALESHKDISGAAYLLRSVAVAPSARGRGIGDALVSAAIAHADAPVALLTETAADYFAARGFDRVARANLPSALSASAELAGACPTSAVAMIRQLSK